MNSPIAFAQLHGTRLFCAVVFSMSPHMGIASEPLEGANVVVISTNQGRGADTYIRIGEAASTNYGNEHVMAMKSFPPGTKKGYVRFDLEQIKEKTITEAELVFTTFNNHSLNETVNVFGLIDGHGDALWEEGTGGKIEDPSQGINYNSAPANGKGPGGTMGTDADLGVNDSEAVYLGSFTVSREDPVIRQGEVFRFREKLLTEHLNTLKGGTATFILTASSRKNLEDVGFATKENPTFAAPELRVIHK